MKVAPPERATAAVASGMLTLDGLRAMAYVIGKAGERISHTTSKTTTRRKTYDSMNRHIVL